MADIAVLAVRFFAFRERAFVAQAAFFVLLGNFAQAFAKGSVFFGEVTKLVSRFVANTDFNVRQIVKIAQKLLHFRQSEIVHISIPRYEITIFINTFYYIRARLASKIAV